MMKHLFISYVVIFLLFFAACDRNPNLLTTEEQVSPRTTYEEAQQFYDNLVSNVIEDSFQIDLCETTESRWQGAFWGMGLVRYRSASADSAIRESFNQFDDRSEDFQRALLEVSYQLYPDEFYDEVKLIAHRTNHPRIFALAVHYLIRSAADGEPSEFTDRLQTQFPDWRDDAILKQLHRFLEEQTGQRILQRPRLVDLLSHSFDTNHPVLFSVQRKNRGYPGLMLIRNSGGRFLREQDGNIWTIPHFARSAADLPTYITNGNSPQGVYVIRGSAYSENIFIGPTPTLQLQLPFEASVGDFFMNKETEHDTWSEAGYGSLLPVSWKNYSPIYDTFYAGKAGRNEIIAHGTTINPEYYRDEHYYPFTPSLGCLTALELWDPFTGVCIHSDQVKLMNAYNSLGSGRGYLILIELDNEEKGVQLMDVLDDINLAERIIKK